MPIKNCVKLYMTTSVKDTRPQNFLALEHTSIINEIQIQCNSDIIEVYTP